MAAAAGGADAVPSTPSRPPRGGAASATVVKNPIGPDSTARARLRTSFTQAQQLGAVYTTAAATAFKEKPFQSSIVIMSFFSLLFNVIALFTPWLQYSTGKYTDQNGVTKEVFGYATLLEYRACSNIDGATATDYQPVRSCTIAFMDNGGNIIRTALLAPGAACFGFVVIALVTNILATYMSYMRRIGAMATVPNCLAKLKVPIVTPVLHGLTAFFLMVAFSIWVGQITAKASLDFDRGLLMDPDFDPALAPLNRYYTGGFGLAIVACLLSMGSASLSQLYSNEIPASVAAANTPAEAATAAVAAQVAGSMLPASSLQPDASTRSLISEGGGSGGGGSGGGGDGYGDSNGSAAAAIGLGLGGGGGGGGGVHAFHDGDLGDAESGGYAGGARRM